MRPEFSNKTANIMSKTTREKRQLDIRIHWKSSRTYKTLQKPEKALF